jgi:hypothetical protein
MMKPRRVRWEGHGAHMGAKRNTHRALIGEKKGKRLLGRSGRRQED